MTCTAFPGVLAAARAVPALLTMLAIALSTPAAAATAAEAGAPPARHEFGYVTMRDGVRLAYSLYLPEESERVPVLMQYDPYVGGGMRVEVGIGGGERVPELLRRGYGALAVSMRGTGCSEGAFEILSDVHVDDAREVVEWAGSQSWSNGRIGAWGNSYGGMTQYLIGAARPRYLKALAAGASSGDLYTDTVYPGGIFNAGMFAEWSLVKEPWAASLGATRRLAAGDAACEATRARQPHNGVYRAMRSHPLLDDWWESQSLLRRAATIEVPTLVVQAWQDEQVGVKGAIDLFHSLRSTKKLIVGNGSHGFYGTPAVSSEVMRWFDRWLKDEDNGIDREPAVTVLFEQRSGPEGGPGWVRTYSDFPPPAAEPKTFFLDAKERLVEERAALESEPGTKTYRYPSATELTWSDEAFSLVPGAWGALTWRSEPLAEDVVVTGSPVVALVVSSTATDTDFMAVLHDVRADGRVQFVQRGFLRASHRGPAEGTTEAQRPAPLQPVHRHDRTVPLEPEQETEIQIALLPVGHVFRRGHRIELVLTAPPPPQMTQDVWGFDALPEAALNTVHVGSARPSRLLLPWLAGESAAAELAPCGALANQPCRDAEAKAPADIIERYERRGAAGADSGRPQR